MPQTVAMSMTGHKTDAVFRRYNISSDDDKREAIRKMAAYRKGRKHEPRKVVRFNAAG